LARAPKARWPFTDIPIIVDAFLIRVALAGVGVALAAGPLGCFVLWRRMAYFRAATAPAALPGVALALAPAAPMRPGGVLAGLSMAWAVVQLTGRGRAADALLGVFAHAALALGLVAVSGLPSVRVDLMAYLFGDILAVRRVDVLLIWAGAAAVLALLAWRWQPLLTATLNPDLAYASGIAPRRETLVVTLTVAVVVAVALKVVGALLIAAMLIIPAAAARPVARTPEAMALWAAGIGAVSAVLGIAASATWDTPTGPSIVTCAFGAFVLTSLIGRRA